MKARAVSGFGAPRNMAIGSTPTDDPPSGVKYCSREDPSATRTASLWNRP